MPLSSDWAPVVAAVGASLATAVGTWGVSAWTLAKASTSGKDSDRRAAYLDLLGACVGLTVKGQGLAVERQVRSTWRDGPLTLLGLRPPLDHMRLNEGLSERVDAVLRAQARLWVVGTQDAIHAADAAAFAAAEFLSAASDAQLATALKQVARCTADFVQVIRTEFGEVPVTLTIDA